MWGACLHSCCVCSVAHARARPARTLLLQYSRTQQAVPTPDLCAAFADLTDLRMAEVRQTTFFLDTRPATDPESRGFAHHTGTHPFIMFHVAQWASKKGWFKDVRTALRNATLGFDVGEYRLVLYCRQGKHRSVAMAMLLYETLRVTQRYTPSAPVAFLHWNDLAKCRGWPQCGECSNSDHALSREAVLIARESWGRNDEDPAGPQRR